MIVSFFSYEAEKENTPMLLRVQRKLEISLTRDSGKTIRRMALDSRPIKMLECTTATGRTDSVTEKES